MAFLTISGNCNSQHKQQNDVTITIEDASAATRLSSRLASLTMAMSIPCFAASPLRAIYRSLRSPGTLGKSHVLSLQTLTSPAVQQQQQQQPWIASDLALPPQGPRSLSQAGTPWATQGLRRLSTESPEQPQPEDPHPCFPGLSQSNPVQAPFERAEVARAYDRWLSSRWYELWEGPGEGLVARFKLVWSQLYFFVFGGVLRHLSDVAAQMVQNEVEGAFQREEFIDGATDAIQHVIQCVGAQDWSTLNKTCSARLLERWQLALSELDQGQGLHLSSLEVTRFYNARLSSINLWKSDNVAMFDESWPKQVNEATSSSWLVVTVSVSVELIAVHKDVKSQKQLPPKHMIRQGLWLFTRGPLPRGFSSNLNLPWRVLTVG